MDSYGNAYQSPENTLDCSTRGVNENEAHFGHSSFQETACFESEESVLLEDLVGEVQVHFRSSL